MPSATRTIGAVNTHNPAAATCGAPSRGGQDGHSVRRRLEMVTAMLAGMLTLAPVERLVWPGFTARADVAVLVPTGPSGERTRRHHRSEDVRSPTTLDHGPETAHRLSRSSS